MPIPTKAQRAEIIELLVSTGKALQRIFLINTTIAVVSIYLTLDAWDKLPLRGPLISPLTAVVESDLKGVGPVLEVGNYLNRHPDIVAKYRAFLAPFSAIEEAAIQAIVAAKVDSPEWRATDANDLRLARDLSASLVQIDSDGYTSDDLKAVSVSFVRDFYRQFVKPELALDDAAAIARIQAASRVAESLKARVTIVPPPASVHFPNFVKTIGDHEDLVELLDKAREIPDIDSHLRALEELCKANEITSCTASGINSVLNSGNLKLPTSDSEPKIELSFLPTGFEPRLLLALSPLALLIGSYLFLSLHWRRGTLLAVLKADDGPEELISPETPWLLPSALVPLPPTTLIRATHRVVLRAILWAGELLPLTSQVLVILYLNHLRSTGVKTWIWLALGALSLVLTAIGTFDLARDQFQEVRSALQRFIAATSKTAVASGRDEKRRGS